MRAMIASFDSLDTSSMSPFRAKKQNDAGQANPTVSHLDTTSPTRPCIGLLELRLAGPESRSN